MASQTAIPNIDLDDLDDPCSQAEEQEFDSSSVPAGVYQVVVSKAELGKTQQSQLRRVNWHFKIIAGDHKDRLIFKNSMLEGTTPERTVQALSFLKTDLSKMGAKLNRIVELPGILENVLDKALEIKLTVNEKGSNVYINKVLDLAPSEAMTSGKSEMVVF